MVHHGSPASQLLRWYSWDDGLVHFVAISTEAALLQGSIEFRGARGFWIINMVKL